MAPGPNQVDVHHHVAAHIVGKEMGTQIAIQGQQRDGNRQDWERGDNQDVRAQRRPAEYRHLEHGHSWRTHLNDGHKEVDTGQGCTNTGQLDCPYPIIDPDAWTVLYSRERRIRQPTGLCEFTYAQRQVNQDYADNGEPEAQVVQERECNVTCTDLQWNHQVHQTDNKWHCHEEDHNHAVSREDLIVVVRRQEARFTRRSQRLLTTHHDGVGKATNQHDDCNNDIHDAKAFVVNRSQPLFPQVGPLTEVSD